MNTSQPPDQSLQSNAFRHETTALAVLLTLLGGLALTLLLYGVFDDLDEQRLQERVFSSGNTLSLYGQNAALGEFFVPVREKMMSLQARFSGESIVISEETLRDELWEEPLPGVGEVHFEYLPRVTGRGEGVLDEALGQSETAGMPIVEFREGVIRPVQEREVYYPVLLEVAAGEERATPGLDRGADELVRYAMEQAAITGWAASYSSYPLSGEEVDHIATRYFIPLYSGGEGVPDTLEERREKHNGFISLVSYMPSEEMQLFMPEDLPGINYAAMPNSGNPETNTIGMPESLQMAIEDGTAVEAGYTVPTGENMRVVATASPELVAQLASPQKIWVLAGGSILTFGLCYLILWNRQHAQRVMQLVQERTRELALQTELLSESNEALKASESRYRMLADNVTDVIYTYDLDGHYTYISPSITLQTGLAVSDFLGAPVWQHLTPASARWVRAILARVQRAISEGREPGREYRTFDFDLRCQDGSVRTFETTVSALAGTDGKVEGFLGVARDVTDRIRSSREKAVLEEAYRHSQKMEAIGTLAGGVAHDFNNLLTALLGHAELLEMEVRNNPSAMQNVKVIERAALRARDLTNQLLGFARKGRFQEVPVDMDNVIEEVRSFIERTMDKNIVIRHEPSERPAIILGDPVQMSQVFLNLAVNARDAMPEGGSLTFRTELQSLDDEFCRSRFEAEGGDYCVVSVSDTGKGIAESRLKRIFEPFFTDKADGKGTGMGLAMVYGVTKSHGGGVTVESQLGKGTVFRIYLPLSDATSEPQKPPKRMTPQKGEGTILLVDDEEMVRKLAEQMLKRLGYQVVMAEDGVAALDYYREHWQAIDLVILDMVMPRMGGLDCLRAMRGVNPDIVAILSSGYSHEQLSEHEQEAGLLGLLHKPYRLQELSELVSAGLEKQRVDA